MEPGIYELTVLPEDSRVLAFTGSHNTIDLSGVQIRAVVGSTRETYITITGNNNVFRNGVFEDYYQSGLTEISDFSAYNNDRSTLAYGLKGAAVMTIRGNYNRVVGTKLTVRGSFPYGYGSQYGIGSTNTFGLNKRCGILITGDNGGGYGNTLDSITLYQQAFGHGIYMQTGADSTTILNTYVEGRMRLSDDMYNDTNTYDLPFISDYRFPTGTGSWRLPFEESYPIPYGVMYPLAEDGIRMYNNTGSITVENTTVKQMRGGIRLYLGGTAIVRNSKAIDCGFTNFNMSADGIIENSVANFAYAPWSDFRLSRNRQNIELTLEPSPHAIGPHNMADILGGGHDILLHRTAGPIDTTTRPMVVYGNNSTINNETEYHIILDDGTSGNHVTSCGPVTDNGNNNITISNCEFDLGCGEPQDFEITDNFAEQTGIFIYSFEAIPTGLVNPGVIGLSGNALASGYNDLAVIVQFNEDGTIKARNGSVYEAQNTLAWEKEETYTIVFSVDMSQKQYDVSVTTSNGNEVIIARNYTFRTDWIETPSLNRTVIRTASCPLQFSNPILTPVTPTANIFVSTPAIQSPLRKFEIYNIQGQLLSVGQSETDAFWDINHKISSKGLYIVKSYGENLSKPLIHLKANY